MSAAKPLLDAVDLAELRRVLTPLSDGFVDIRVFGSRATGRSRSTSDLDLVIYGADSRTICLIVDALEDSFLPMTVDLVAYETITSDLLRQHIDRVAKPLPLGEGALDTASVQATGG